MTDIVKRATVRRGKHDSLRKLLDAKGLHNDYDGWRGFVERLNRVPHTNVREIEVVCFKPTEEEHEHFGKGFPPVYAKRGLTPASLFEVLALVPDFTGYKSQESFTKEFGDDFIMFAHGHWQGTWLREQAAYLETKYGHLRHCDCGVLAPHTMCWYVGFKKITGVRTDT